MQQLESAARLAEQPTASTAHMSHQERTDGIAQMLADLERLAKQDGCIAAAWALEKLCDVAGKHLSPSEPAAVWQTIETAPKDGTYILLGYFLEMGGGGGPEIAHWDSAKKLWHGRGGPLNADGYFSPTHWLPLPSPPSSAPSPPEPVSEVAVIDGRRAFIEFNSICDLWFIWSEHPTQYMTRSGHWRNHCGKENMWPTEAAATAFLQNLQTERGMG